MYSHFKESGFYDDIRISVFEGSFTATVPARSAIAVHTGAMGTSDTVAVTFAETATTVFGEVCEWSASVYRYEYLIAHRTSS